MPHLLAAVVQGVQQNNQFSTFVLPASLKMAAPKEKDGRPGKPAGKESQPLIIAKTAAEEQRLKLERLMRNPDKPAPIPERPKDWNPRAPPEFVRDVMGSSAGAGSGEFHVYRHLRRREYQRQDFLDRMTEKENQKAADERTAKRKKKRDKLKQKKLMAKKSKLESKTDEDPQDSSSSSEQEEQEHEAEDDADVPSFIMGKR
ncbi:hypothetical protein JZ751_019256 [Albula glossodonta]|uniref:PRKR-interacting protein 1 n=1 Tax=Albula glossodonta TaxID=121402 RepID=A0A8T2NP97_9TELE|nr:hypothetical protein JZ751_019256 [Albula glossodonta]